MYLAGSLERHRLRPKVRVTVVCPAGMATAWILVSRLLAEFPQVEIVRVVSKAAFELDERDLGSDLIVSTVPLEGADAAGPSLVVSPLLRDRDVRRLSRVLGAPAH
jgi:mannitol operon transcriptional antiterminator